MRQTDLHAIQGLSSNEVLENLRRFGYNEIPNPETRTILKIIKEVTLEPMFVLLIACGTTYIFLGDLAEALVLLGFVIIVMAITIRQERKSEHALEALRDLSSPRALVIRDGIPQRIPGREVVVGDCIVLVEGDRIPADGILTSCSNMTVDESLLTGESVPVRKSSQEVSTPINSSSLGGDDSPFVYSGTLVVQGQAIAKVLHIGLETQMGKIGKALHTIVPESTKIQKETTSLVKKLAIIGLIFCLLVFLGYGIFRHDWFKGILAGLTLAMAMLPEEFPVVLTIFLAVGAWRMTQKKVLTRSIPCVETLGSATVLCVDKTGTLTQNQMTVSTLWSQGEFWQIPINIALSQHDTDNTTSSDKHTTTDDAASSAVSSSELPEIFHEVVEYGILASQKEPFDPMEKALRSLGYHYLCTTEHWHEDFSLIQEYPLSKNLLAVSYVWRSPSGQEYVVAAKGAPEAIADLCHLEQDKTAAVMKITQKLAQEGLRVLGVAKASFQKQSLPILQHDFIFHFLGLVGLHDPIRPSVPQAIQECYKAGLRVVMITGDYPVTAQNIAKQIGLDANAYDTIIGSDLGKLTDDELDERISHTAIFARVVPEQKIRIVCSLKKRGDIVAMTGDGVNDAPSLKAAHIGIAMGGRGTDVAREASDLVLLEDDFISIVEAVKMGRRIFDNLQKAMIYILSVHIPIAGISMLPALFHDGPLILFPMHIVFLELVIDPACSIIFEAEPEEKDVMLRPPRSMKEPLFGLKEIIHSIFQGVSVLIVALGMFIYAREMQLTEEHTRALTYTTLILGNIWLIVVNRSLVQTSYAAWKRPNSAFWYVIVGTLLFLMCALYMPMIRDLLKLTPLSLTELIASMLVIMITLSWIDIVKIYRTQNNA